MLGRDHEPECSIFSRRNTQVAAHGAEEMQRLQKVMLDTLCMLSHVGLVYPFARALHVLQGDKLQCMLRLRLRHDVHAQAQADMLRLRHALKL